MLKNRFFRINLNIYESWLRQCGVRQCTGAENSALPETVLSQLDPIYKSQGERLATLTIILLDITQLQKIHFASTL